MQAVPLGASGQASITVAFEQTLTFYDSRLPRVYSTPDMIRLLETAAFFALEPYCEADEISVGTHIDVSHRAATGIGSRVTAEAVLESFDGKFYVFRVSARDQEKEIGSGRITRAVVSVGRFTQKLVSPS